MTSLDRSDFADLADLAVEAARRGRKRLEQTGRSEIRVAATKSSSTDLVTETDRAVETEIITTITGARPDDGILAEESGHRPGSSGVTWIVDPIDGTTNFFYGLPGYNISIAAAHDGRVVAGVVVDPVRDETFRAVRGGGATCNGVTVRGGSPPDLAHSLVGTGFSYTAERRRHQAGVVAALIGRIRDIRRQGAAALDLCAVAAGRLDGYFESGLKPWDLAAGGLMVTEAGCRISGPDGAPPDGRLVIAAAPGVFDALADALADAAAHGLAVADPSARTGWKFGRLEV